MDKGAVDELFYNVKHSIEEKYTREMNDINRQYITKKLPKNVLQLEAAKIESKRMQAQRTLLILFKLAREEVNAHERYKDYASPLTKQPQKVLTTLDFIAREEYHHLQNLMDLMKNIISLVFD